MNTAFLQGTGVALVTPFDEQNSIDFEALTRVVNHVIHGGIDYLVVMGTTGESVVLSQLEKQQVINHILSVNKERVPVVLGIGGNYTGVVTRLIEEQDFTGIDALLSVSPYYNKPSQDGIYAHFEAVAQAAPVPIIIYNVPGRTGSMISAGTTLRLAELNNIAATKEASGDMASIMEIMKNKPDSFKLISGDDALTLPMIALGADGVISVIANAMPNEMSTLVKHALKQDMDVAREIHYQLLPMIDLIFKEGSPTGIKAALHRQDLIKNYLRLPLITASEKLYSEISRYV